VLRLLIDTDTASDDCISLLIALHSPGVTVEAITINCGNIADFNQMVENALYTVEIAGFGGQVPVYPGAVHPLLHPHPTVEHIHGADGMGESYFPRARQRPEREHAVSVLIRMINANPGALTIIAQAPLTNLALAVRQDPSITRKIRHLWVMGGVNNALGNDSPAAEFNILADPEAAKIVFGAGFPMTMVGWDISLRYGTLYAAALAEIEVLDTPLSRFYLAVNRVVRRHTKHQYGYDAITHPDSLVAAMAIDESIMTRSGDFFVDVETRGELTRGYTLVDLLKVWKRPSNVRVCLEADTEKFRQKLMQVLA
jgi:purine nucleosidase